MARRYKFVVSMDLADDDQTDPEDMANILKDVLSYGGRGHAIDWHYGMQDMDEAFRPKIDVEYLDVGAFARMRLKNGEVV